MKLVADESVDRQIVERLRQGGHAVWYVAEMEPGIPDERVLDLACEYADLLLTADKDLSELVYRQGRFAPGILLVRLAGLTPAQKADLVAVSVDRHSAELPGAFGVLTPRSFRIRRLA